MDMLIAGGGPAGITAAIYAARAGLQVLVIEQLGVGGQAAVTSDIENYPGFPRIMGADFAEKLEEHAKSAGVKICYEQITGFSLSDKVKRVKTTAGEYQAGAVVLAMGARHRLLDIPGEKEFTGRGVSYCATCDGAFFRKKTAAVVGGGNTALEDALYLSKLCERVYLVHRRKELRADGYLQERLKDAENIVPVLETVPERIEGENAVRSLAVKNTATGKESNLSVSGVFVAVGTLPRTELVRGAVETDESGYIVAGETCATGLPGVFAAGDIRKKPLRQIVTAAADGANAANSAAEYLRKTGRE